MITPHELSSLTQACCLPNYSVLRCKNEWGQNVSDGIYYQQFIGLNPCVFYFSKRTTVHFTVSQKTTTEDPTKIDTVFLRKLLNKDIFLIIDSGFAIIQYYCEKDKSHSFFPFGFGDIVIKPLELDDIHDFFALVDDNPNSDTSNQIPSDENIS